MLHAKIGPLVVERGFFGQSLWSGRVTRNLEMVDPRHPALSSARQRLLIGINRSDQGSQFKSPRFTQILLETTVKISMGGRGR